MAIHRVPRAQVYPLAYFADLNGDIVFPPRLRPITGVKQANRDIRAECNVCSR